MHIYCIRIHLLNNFSGRILIVDDFYDIYQLTIQTFSNYFVFDSVRSDNNNEHMPDNSVFRIC